MQKQFSEIKLLLVGCGKMGSALLKGWIAEGLRLQNIGVNDPYPSEWLKSLEEQGVSLNQQPETAPDIVVLATKPQMMSEAVPNLKYFGNGKTLFISIAAGTLISTFESMLGEQTPIVRAMPNTPAAIGCGVTGLVANKIADADAIEMATLLMQAVGKTVSLNSEDEMHAITAVSGSGPAYVFALAEAMETAAINKGLLPEAARLLAIEIIKGAGKLMAASAEHPRDLRLAVTSPNGTTQAGLEVLLDETDGIKVLIDKTVSAAHKRSIELSKSA